MKKIDIEKYTIPKKNDNINKLYEVTSLIFISEKMSNLHIVKFSK